MFCLLWMLFSTVLAAQFVVQVQDEQALNGLVNRYPDINFDKIDTYSFESFCAFSGEFCHQTLKKLYNDPQVAAISRDKELRLQEIVLQSEAPAHLVGLSSVLPHSRQPFIYNSNAGNGVDVYLLDTGIDIKHPSLQKVNILQLADLTQHALPHGTDPHGHGTAIAGLIASETFGVIKKCNLVNVRIAESNGTVKTSTLLRALSLTHRHIEKTKRPSVVVIPLEVEGGVNPTIRDAITNFNPSVSVVIAAGNQHSDACNYSPANVSPKPSNVLVVGALDSHRRMAPFTNYGTCVDIYASGLDVTTIQSTDLAQDSLTRLVSGTSASGALTAGVVGYYMSSGLNSTQAVEKVLQYSKCIKTFVKQIPKDMPCAKLLQLHP